MKKSDIVKQYTRKIYERICRIAEEKGLTMGDIARQLEESGAEKVGRNSAYDWGIGKSDSFLNHLDRICELLDTTEDFILHIDHSGNNIINSINESPNSTLTITENNLSKQERELVEIYRNLSLMGQMDLITYALKLKNGGQ